MKKNEFDLLMSEIREVKSDVRQVRLEDVPAIHTRLAIMEERMEDFKKKVGTRSTVYSSIGGALAVVTSILMSHFTKQQ